MQQPTFREFNNTFLYLKLPLNPEPGWPYKRLRSISETDRSSEVPLPRVLNGRREIKDLPVYAVPSFETHAPQSSVYLLCVA